MASQFLICVLNSHLDKTSIKQLHTYASTFMDEIEINFLNWQEFKLLVWFRYIDNLFFIWTHEKEFLKRFQRCAMCLNFNETSAFTSSVTHDTCKTNHKLDFNSKCLIYLSTCKQCSEQYAGQTIDDFRFRWNKYKDNNRKY